MSTNAISDEILELIFLRLGSQLCLVRAASTCKRWRRVIAGCDFFLRRFRSLHPATIAGAYNQQTFVPSSCAASIINSRHFSLDFLPYSNSNSTPWAWSTIDSRGSLLLLERIRDEEGNLFRQSFREIAVCEPMTRRYTTIPAAEKLGDRISCAFLVDGDKISEAGCMPNFRVLCLLYDHTAAVFQPDGSWKEFGMNLKGMSLAGITTSSLYWFARPRTIAYVDRSTMQCSSFVLPPDVECWDALSCSCHGLRVVEGRDGKLRIVTASHGGHLKVFARLQGGIGEWALETRVNSLQLVLRVPPRVGLEGDEDRYPPWFFISGVAPLMVSASMKGPWIIHLESGAVEVEGVCGKPPHPVELPWPPEFHVCTHDHGT